MKEGGGPFPCVMGVEEWGGRVGKFEEGGGFEGGLCV